jgi:outer membrane receptor protein involved in Fe transport
MPDYKFLMMVRLRKLLLTLIFIFSITISYSNISEVGIKGNVRCTTTLQPLEYATVSLGSLPDSAIIDNVITDIKGLFRFKTVPPGKYYLVIQYMGYEKKFIDGIVINEDSKIIDLGTISLQISVSDLKEFEVKEDKNALSFEIDRKVINVSKELVAEGGTAVDALQNAPSVKVDALGNVLLRGSADFTLLINGKPTMMEPSLVLQQTLAETIESIEIITNPSVKYEAKGTTGIINLKLKKQNINKTEGLVNLSIANGDKYSGSIMFNRQFGKISAFTGISYSNKTQRTTNWGYRDVSNSDSSYHESIDAKRMINRTSVDFKIGMDYALNENNNLSISCQTGNWLFRRNISSAYQKEYGLSSEIFLYQDTEEEFSLKNKFLSGDISYSHLFKNKEGHNLDITAFYGGLTNNTNDDFLILNTPEFRQIENASDRDQYRISADYTLPLKHEISFEAGLFSDIQISSYDYLVSTVTDTNEYAGQLPETGTSFDYSNRVIASYASVSGDVKKWFSFRAGLRAEFYTYSLEGLNNEMNYTSSADNLFPSVHLSRELNDRHRFGLSYSRRVNRPDEWQLCPVIYSADIYEMKTGNPYLLQSLVDSYELSYLFSEDKVQLNTELYYRDSHDPIGSFLLETDGRFVETYDNLDRETNSGIELMGTYKPLGWLQFQVSANAYHSRWEGVLMDGNKLDGSSFQYDGSFTSSVTIKKNTTVQFLAFYYAPSEIPQGKADAFYYFDFILKQSLFKKKLTLGLRTHNTFDSGLYHYDVNGNDYYAENWYRYEGPVFIFTLGYKLNNFKPKQSDPGVRMDFDSGLDH